ncbi:hypothetical protein BJ165DRAFT_1350015 [Panaeolus papilionaceus]|nr:hypothetical protein BJ165DRAFT_1350015 [Panaeolus papilionaceus]
MFNETVAHPVSAQFEAVTSMTQEQYVRVASNLMIAKMYSLAACVMIFYDMAITFGEEVEQIWMRKFSLLTVLWFLNRYLSPLGYIVIIVSFHDPWSKEVCDRYILYPEALKVVTTSVVGAIFIMRLHAIYSRSVFIIILGCVLLTVELGLKIWAFTDGKSIDLPPGLVGCILVGTEHARFAVTWIAELGFDTAVFLLTLWKTFEHNWRLQGNATSLINLILRDGIMYYAIIFAANLLTVLLFLVRIPDIKAINASFSTL